MLILTLLILFAGCACIPGVFIFWLARRHTQPQGMMRLLKASIAAQFLVSLVALGRYHGGFLFLFSLVVFPTLQVALLVVSSPGNESDTPTEARQPKPVRKTMIALGAMAGALLISMIDRVDLEGSHTSYLVIAPYPTLGFRYGGGEEGAWQRAHPDLPPPWWHEGRYFMLMEVTDS